MFRLVLFRFVFIYLFIVFVFYDGKRVLYMGERIMLTKIQNVCVCHILCWHYLCVAELLLLRGRKRREVESVLGESESLRCHVINSLCRIDSLCDCM